MKYVPIVVVALLVIFAGYAIVSRQLSLDRIEE